MVIFLEGMNLERRNNIAKLLKKEFEEADIFAIGLVHNKLQKELHNIEFDYEKTVENLIDVTNVTFYLKNNDEDEKAYLTALDELILPKAIIDVVDLGDKEIANEVINYVYTRL